MTKWEGGPLPFKADAIASIWGERNCLYWAYRVGDKLYLRIRGSRPPYPISEAQLIGDGYYGSGSLMIWKDGFLNIFWPNKDVDKVMQKYAKASDIPDPSHEHPPHPDYPYYEKYSMHLIDVFAYAYNHPTWDIEPLIERVAQTGASAIQAFGWAGYPPQQYDIEAIPWLWVDGKVDFLQKNPKYELTFKKIAVSCKDYERKYRHTLFLSRYNFHIFKSNLNKQGIPEFYSPEGLAVQEEHVLDVLRWNKEVGIDEPDVVLMNEPGHYGDDDTGHIIADWHRKIGDLCIQHTPIENVRSDVSHSEYPRAWWVGPHECPKPENHEEPFYFGREKYSHRPQISEVHGCSTLRGLMESGAEVFYGSANMVWAVSEDGSKYGSTIVYNPDGSIAFRFADAEEYRDLLEYVKGKDERTGKDTHVVGFPTGMLHLGEGDFSDLSKINWEKYDLYKQIIGG
ncbi:hypothetical protein LCGC14_0460720 [marine sediment metagenome]|uniref:Uncharacterized protein n=1 Tax=marine sediment metagenome TaxID=412755 RepID=A0A0F9SF29_9ZZZZ|nr:hypothetical protein [bacterium]